MTEAEEQLVDDIEEFAADPLGYVLYAWPWGTEELPEAGPRAWQADILEQIGKHLQNPETRFMPLQIAVASGHGIGKSALISMIVEWAMSTCEDTRIVVTANTKAQLDKKTWPEIQKWFRKAINAAWWVLQTTAIFTVQKSHAKAWRADSTPWSDKNTEAFAGLHNKGKRIVVIFDEASAIVQAIWEVTEGALTDEGTEILWICFGNPTRNTGSFRECFRKFKHRWLTRQIDSRTVEGTNKAQIQKWIDDWGADSDFVRVRVRGEFPRAASGQFIASDVVAAARQYKAQGYEALPKILSCDVARFGDDQTVIGLRQGRKFRVLAQLRGMSTVQTAERVIEWMEREQPDATVIDGDGVGGGVVDQIRHRGHGKKLHEFHGNNTPDAPQKYKNRRAEVWGMTRDWLGEGAEIPDMPELEDDVCGPEYFFTPDGQIQLESKDDMRARGLPSPDLGDTLAMSFSVKVAPPGKKPAAEQHYGAGGWMG